MAGSHLAAGRCKHDCGVAPLHRYLVYSDRVQSHFRAPRAFWFSSTESPGYKYDVDFNCYSYAQSLRLIAAHDRILAERLVFA